MINRILETLSKNYPLNKIDNGEYAKISKKGMNFLIDSYSLEGLGNVSSIKMNAMLGLMKMDTIVIVPLKKDVPILSFDLIHVMGKDTLIIDMYDLTVNKGQSYPTVEEVYNKYKNLPPYELKSCWYDDLRIKGVLASKGKKLLSTYNEAMDEYLTTFIELFKNASECNEDEKRKVVQEYVNNLFKYGSPTVEQFSKLISQEKAIELYSKYVFFGSKID